MNTIKTGRDIAKEMLDNYVRAAAISDTLIAQYEALEDLRYHTASQIARMKELETVEIPNAVEKDKALKKKVRELLDLPNPPLTPWTLRVLELRYLGLMKWNDVLYALYGDNEDFEKRRRHYITLMHKTANKGITSIGAAIDRQNTNAEQK